MHEEAAALQKLIRIIDEIRNHGEVSAMKAAAGSFLHPGELSGKFLLRAAQDDLNINIRRK